MGAILGCITGAMSSVGCCFTQAACRFCCKSCPTTRYSTATRFGYAALLVLGVIFSYLTRVEFVKSWLVKVPNFCNENSINDGTCLDSISTEVVYRIWMVYAIFFFFMSLFTIDVRTSRDIRAMFHTGFWIFKVVILVGIAVGLSFAPVDSQFSKVSMILGFIGTIVFLIIQLMMLIDFVYTWNESWISRAEDNSSGLWYGALFCFTVLMYLATFAMIVCMYIFVAKSEKEWCHTPKFLVSLQLIICVVISIVSLLPRVQESIPSSGVLQASAIGLYTSYMLFTALANSKSECNYFEDSGSITNTLLSVASTIFTLFMVAFTSLQNEDQNKISMIGLQNESNGLSSHQEAFIEPAADNKVFGGRKAQAAYDDEEEAVKYSYSLFHFMLMMCSLYLMMVLSDWQLPYKSESSQVAGVWIKVVTSWVCILLYVWTLMAPILLKDRDFGYH